MKFLSSPQELRQMVQCLELHYRQQKHQKEIAQALGISSSKVSRLLKRAFEEGLIRVELDLPLNPRLGGMMAAKYRPPVAAYALPVQHLASLSQIERERRRLLRAPEVRKIYEGAQNVDVALVGIGFIGEGTPGFCSLAGAYGGSFKTLGRLGVVGEVNYQPFDAGGKVVDRPELRPLSRRMLSVTADRLQALSRADATYVIGVGGGGREGGGV